MSRLKTLVRNENGVPPLRGGHSLCQGCGIPMVVRTVLDSIQGPKVVVNATGCLEVATTRFPTTAWNVPWLHLAFENAAAGASGVEAAYRALRRRGGLPQDDELTIVAFAGDGGTYDIGLQALSGALERGHRFVFVCYDNQAYMNTGVQRSGATPFGASTTTSPAGAASFGKVQQRKDLTAIVAAHHIPYVGAGGRRPALAGPEPEGGQGGEGRRPGVPERARRLPARLGPRGAALARDRRRRRRELPLAAVRGRPRRLAADVPAGASCPSQTGCGPRSASPISSAPAADRWRRSSAGRRRLGRLVERCGE